MKELNLDPELKAELEQTNDEQVFAEYGVGGAQSEKEKSIQFADKWFPDKTEWHGKTHISAQQAKPLAIARQLAELFPEIAEYEPVIETLLTDYEKLLTSIDGESRSQQVQILSAVFGKDSEMDEAAKSAAMQMFAQKEDEND